MSAGRDSFLDRPVPSFSGSATEGRRQSRRRMVGALGGLGGLGALGLASGLAVPALAGLGALLPGAARAAQGVHGVHGVQAIPGVQGTHGTQGGHPTLAGGDGRPERRTALVIGNGNYPDAKLRNPVPDARLVARTFSDLDFEVTLALDASLATMRDGMRRWLIDSGGADVRAFYFAGHGIQYRGSNYLIPVDALFEGEDEIADKSFRLQDLVERLARTRDGVNCVVLDACRAEPSALLTRVTRRTRSLERPENGLSPTAAPRGTVIAYSTAPGALAADGGNQGNSVFTRALAQWMPRPGMTIETVFKQVRMTVMRETGNTQVPWETSSLVGEFCLRSNSRGQCGPQS